ncbi:MAG: LysE family translocator [Peptococcaceae bacterium]
MYGELFIKGIIIGLSIAAPVGPIGILCIRRTLTQGRIAGLLTGLGAATADAIYGIIAGFGITIITNILIAYQQEIGLVGGILLCFLGGKTLLARPIKAQILTRDKALAGSYFSTLLLTLTNPLTIIFFMAIFTSLNPQGVQNSLTPAILVLGVFGGSALWWLMLSLGVNFIRSIITDNFLKVINILSGTIIICFGIWSFC